MTNRRFAAPADSRENTKRLDKIEAYIDELQEGSVMIA